VEVTDIGKHSSLLRYGKNYRRKKFYGAGLWTHLGQRNAAMMALSLLIEKHLIENHLADKKFG
jgi:hypothetical protein